MNMFRKAVLISVLQHMKNEYLKYPPLSIKAYIQQGGGPLEATKIILQAK